ncbi:MAG: hypothetical protein M1823_006026 [Watsoniomyces obsoletus]|nr:MAG: hypothetical protein M1823_006026 [Watsoniomyces obsoletus]
MQRNPEWNYLQMETPADELRGADLLSGGSRSSKMAMESSSNNNTAEGLPQHPPDQRLTSLQDDVHERYSRASSDQRP